MTMFNDETDPYSLGIQLHNLRRRLESANNEIEELKSQRDSLKAKLEGWNGEVTTPVPRSVLFMVSKNHVDSRSKTYPIRIDDRTTKIVYIRTEIVPYDPLESMNKAAQYMLPGEAALNALSLKNFI